MASPANPTGARLCVVPRMTIRNMNVITTSHTSPAAERIAAGRVRAIAVGGEASGQAEIRAAARDEVQHACADDAADDLRDDVRQQQGGGKAASRPQADGDRRVEVTARDRAERVRALTTP